MYHSNVHKLGKNLSRAKGSVINLVKSECCFYISWVKTILPKPSITTFHTQRLFSKVKNKQTNNKTKTRPKKSPKANKETTKNQSTTPSSPSSIFIAWDNTEELISHIPSYCRRMRKCSVFLLVS